MLGDMRSSQRLRAGVGINQFSIDRKYHLIQLHMDLKKDDFAQLLTIPSVHGSLEKRLQRDFGPRMKSSSGSRTKKRRSRKFKKRTRIRRHYKPVLLDAAEY